MARQDSTQLSLETVQMFRQERVRGWILALGRTVPRPHWATAKMIIWPEKEN